MGYIITLPYIHSRFRGKVYDPQEKRRLHFPQAVRFSQGDATTCAYCRKGYQALTGVCPHCGRIQGK